jgi:nucleoside-diphosphate kinase
MEFPTESSFVMLKPDALERKLDEQIISILQKEFGPGSVKFMCGDDQLSRQYVATPQLLEEHYAEHQGKPFFPGLIKYVSRGPVVPMVITGLPGTIAKIRQLIGATAPKNSDSGTIRGELGDHTNDHENLIHASDSLASAQRELDLWSGTINQNVSAM